MRRPWHLCRPTMMRCTSPWRRSPLSRKNEALQAVQSSLENLKSEQTAIEETIVELRRENAELRDDGGDAASSPRPILRRRDHDASSNSSIMIKLESRIKKVDKENKGLR